VKVYFTTLRGLVDMGYAYAIVGGAGPTDFYTKTIGAIPIPDSSPGIDRDRLKKTGVNEKNAP
jgi:hypothetical protein